MGQLKVRPSELCEFVDYVESFYGDGGIYDLGFKVTREHIWNATSIHLVRLERERSEFEGDTVDREMVRDLMIKAEKENAYV
jgi:hypothetical protein